MFRIPNQVRLETVHPEIQMLVRYPKYPARNSFVKSASAWVALSTGLIHCALLRVKISISGLNPLLILPSSCRSELVNTWIEVNDRLPKCLGITHGNISNLQSEAWIARAGSIHQTATFTTEVVCHAVAA